MKDTIGQANLKKLVTRLSIAIYKMTDEQLVSVLPLFSDLGVREKSELLQIPKFRKGNRVDMKDRQLLVARIFLLIHQLSEQDLIHFMKRYEEKQFAMLRQYPRVPCQITLDLVTNGRAINCFAMDISVGGMFVESFERFDTGQRLSICFTITDDHLSLKLKGCVVRQEEDGVGVQFMSITDYQSEIMKDLINRLHRQISFQLRAY